MSHYVFSTITNAQIYTSYVSDRDIHSVQKEVYIAGGANRADGKRNVFTPEGVMTEVSNDDMEFLLQHKAFQDHVDRGFITYRSSKADADKVAADMTDRDRSAPLTPSDYEGKSGAHPAITHSDAPAADEKNFLERLLNK